MKNNILKINFLTLSVFLFTIYFIFYIDNYFALVPGYGIHNEFSIQNILLSLILILLLSLTFKQRLKNISDIILLSINIIYVLPILFLFKDNIFFQIVIFIIFVTVNIFYQLLDNYLSLNIFKNKTFNYNKFLKYSSFLSIIFFLIYLYKNEVVFEISYISSLYEIRNDYKENIKTPYINVVLIFFVAPVLIINFFIIRNLFFKIVFLLILLFIIIQIFMVSALKIAIYLPLFLLFLYFFFTKKVKSQHLKF